MPLALLRGRGVGTHHVRGLLLRHAVSTMGGLSIKSLHYKAELPKALVLCQEDP